MEHKQVNITKTSFNILDMLLRDRGDKSAAELQGEVFVKEELEEAFFCSKNDDRSDLRPFHTWLQNRTNGSTAWFQQASEYPYKYEFSEFGCIVLEKFIDKDAVLLSAPAS